MSIKGAFHVLLISPSRCKCDCVTGCRESMEQGCLLKAFSQTKWSERKWFQNDVIYSVCDLFRWHSIMENLAKSRTDRKMQGLEEVSDAGTENPWEHLITAVFRQEFAILLFSLFPWSQFHSLYEECRLNWLCKAKAGRQAEGWSIKLVNHFLFSLRTAVDWWERPLCPPSQPASKFAASPFQCMSTCCGARKRALIGPHV